MELEDGRRGTRRREEDEEVEGGEERELRSMQPRAASGPTHRRSPASGHRERSGNPKKQRRGLPRRSRRGATPQEAEEKGEDEERREWTREEGGGISRERSSRQPRLPARASSAGLERNCAVGASPWGRLPHPAWRFISAARRPWRWAVALRVVVGKLEEVAWDAPPGDRPYCTVQPFLM
ncbi:unnamed protein product [Prorocentrum cordatum]|uniref:Uncharacterized protein n=1 Tax=Prorocentrum cordatum TaxID=2364126 RepID=A0ABN9RGX1_9DINO|nr:unnamed protein product [Polarella glacialis]